MPSLVRAVARPLLAGIYIVGGYNAIKTSVGHAQAAEPVIGPLAEQLPGELDTETLVKIDGGVKIVAGGLLALGRFPRLSALALAGSISVTTFTAHRFWEKDDPGARAQDRIQFLKNLSMLGGLLLAATDAGPRRHDD